MAKSLDTANWIHADWSRSLIDAKARKDIGMVGFNELVVKQIAPWIARCLFAQNLKITEPGHYNLQFSLLTQFIS